MNLFNALPFEIQQYIYTFDGRYKQAMDKTLVLIKEWGRSDGGARFSGNAPMSYKRAFMNWFKPSPEYANEISHRLEQYRRALTPKGSINRSGKAKCMWGQWVNTSGIMLFRDIFGIFKVWKESKIAWIDGEIYHSEKKYFDVIHAFSGFSKFESKPPKCTHTKVSCWMA